MDFRGLDVGPGLNKFGDLIGQGQLAAIQLAHQQQAEALAQKQYEEAQFKNRAELSRYGALGTDANGNPILNSSVPLSVFAQPANSNPLNALEQLSAPDVQQQIKRLRGAPVPVAPPSEGDSAQLQSDASRAPAGRAVMGTAKPTEQDTNEQMTNIMNSVRQMGGHVDENGQVIIPAHALDSYLKFAKPAANQDILGALLGNLIQPRHTAAVGQKRDSAEVRSALETKKQLQQYLNEINSVPIKQYAAKKQYGSIQAAQQAIQQKISEQDQIITGGHAAPTAQVAKPQAQASPKSRDTLVQEFMQKRGVDQATAEKSVDAYLQSKGK